MTQSNRDAAQVHYQAGLKIKAQLINVPRALRAQAAFALATELDPLWADAWFELAITSTWTGHSERAVSALSVALELDPENARAHYLMYHLRADQGDPAAAVEALARAQELDPTSAIAFELERVLAHPQASRKRGAQFPSQIASFADREKAFEKYLAPECGDFPEFLSRESRLITLGSCFARNIAIALHELNVSVEHIESVEDLNTTYANRWFLEWLLGSSSRHEATFNATLGRAYGDALLDRMKSADAYIYSLGVAPCFFERTSNEPVLTLGMNLNIALRSSALVFRTTTVAENVENLLAIRDLLARINPRAVLALTLSPVPLKGTLEHASAIAADCVSKSTLRVAADEFLRARADVVYFPSFEAVRWLAAYTPPVFGAEDGSTFHVNQDLVDMLMRSFIRRFGNEELRADIEAGRSIS